MDSTKRNEDYNLMMKDLLYIAKMDIEGMSGRSNFNTTHTESKDFFEIAIWELRDALVEAYMAGKSSVTRKFVKEAFEAKKYNEDDVDPFELVYKAFVFSNDQVVLTDPETGKKQTPRIVQGIFEPEDISVTKKDEIEATTSDKGLIDRAISTAKEYEIDYKLSKNRDGNYVLTLDPWTVDGEKLYNDYYFKGKFVKASSLRARTRKPDAKKPGRKPRVSI